MKIKNIIDEGFKNFALDADGKAVKESLGELLPNMEAYEQKKGKFKKELDFLIKAQDNQKKTDLLMEVAKRFEEALLKGTEKPVAMLKQMMGTNQAFALNKGFEKLTKEEIIEIIKDKNLIDLLNKLDEE